MNLLSRTVRRSPWLLLAVPGLVAAVRTASAEPVQLEARVGAAHAVGGYQGRELGFGLDTALGANQPIIPELGLDGRLGMIWLSDGAAPRDAGFKNGGAAQGFSARIGAQFRPWAADWGSAASGLWLSAGGGATLTGGLFRPLTEVNVGYDFTSAEYGVGLGPVLTHLHVFQPDTAVRPEDANLLSLGVHFVIHRTAEIIPEDLDPDKDGIPVPQDKCPKQAEDLDNHDDEDGCPDADNDGDGLEDSKDNCPDNAEDLDHFKDEDGCPEADNDQDGVLDEADRCPDEQEDKDGFQDDDGCPELDNDHDGFPDAEDQCPIEAEVKNGYADDDGCPDSEQVRVVGNRIVLDEKVHFQVNNAAIRRVSHVLLKRVADLIADNPDWVHVTVEGHTDPSGSPKFNLKLSSDRAESVMNFLVTEGNIEASRMSFMGYGEEQPISARDDEYSMYLNRRVEFRIQRRQDLENQAKPGNAPPPPPAATPPAPPLPAKAAPPVAAPPAAAPPAPPPAKSAAPPKAAPPPPPPVIELDDEETSGTDNAGGAP